MTTTNVVAGFGAFALIFGLLAMLFIAAGFLLWGARIARIERRSYVRALGATLLSFIASAILSFVSFMFGILPLFGTVAAFVGGFLVEALIMMPIFETTYLRALAAAVISWVLSIVVLLVVAFILAVGFGVMLA